MELDKTKEVFARKFGEEILREHTSPITHRAIYGFVRKIKPEACLELGFYKGVSSSFIAAALQENGTGHLIAIDKKDQFSKLTPSIYDVLGALGLENYVTPIVADTSYNWELMKMIEANTADSTCGPIFDFVFIDGAYTWETDGFAFFLVEKLLKREGWIIFNDYKYTFERGLFYRFNLLRKNKISFKQYASFKQYTETLPEDQRKTAQIDKVINFLVKQHPKFDNFGMDECKYIVWCQKILD